MRIDDYDNNKKRARKKNPSKRREKSRLKKPATHYTFRLNHCMYNRSRTHFFNTQSQSVSTSEWVNERTNQANTHTYTLYRRTFNNKSERNFDTPIGRSSLPSSSFSAWLLSSIHFLRSFAVCNRTFRSTQEFLRAAFLLIVVVFVVFVVARVYMLVFYLKNKRKKWRRYNEY